MIKIEDYENLIKYFEEHECPENLKLFIEKLKIMYEEILYREESKKKLDELRDRLLALDEEKEEK